MDANDNIEPPDWFEPQARSGAMASAQKYAHLAYSLIAQATGGWVEIPELF